MTAKWTVMIYMAATDATMSNRVEDEFEDIRSGLSSPDVRVLAFLKQKDTPGVTHRELCKDGEGERPEDHGEKDVGVPDTVCDFVRWATARAPADRYALILWGHGSGFRQAGPPPASPDRAGRLHGRDGTRGLLFSRAADLKAGRGGFGDEDAMGGGVDIDPANITADVVARHSIEMDELKTTLAGVKEILGHELDLLGMDACLMASVEVLAQVAGCTQVFVGSEHIYTTYGWPYGKVLSMLCENADVPAAELATWIVQSSYDFYDESEKAAWPVTLCAMDCAKWGAFSEQLAALAAELRAAVPSHWRQVRRGHERTASIRRWDFDFGLFDLLSFCRALQAQRVTQAVTVAARAVEEALAPGGVVVKECHRLDDDTEIGGMSIYLPPPPTNQAIHLNPASPPEYRELQFCEDVPWVQFLTAYHRAATRS